MEVIRQYCIAGIRVSLDTDIELFHAWCSDYEVADGDVDMAIRITRHDSITETGVLTLDRDSVKVYSEGDFTTAYYYTDGVMYGAMRYDEGYMHNSIMLLDDVVVHDLGMTDIGYMLLGTIFAYKLTYFDGVSLHGACISYGNSGIIFTAPSGVGKSTQANLWHEVFGDEVTLINDDKPAIRVTPEGIMCYGTPFAGKNHLNANRTAPLRAIVNVVRGDENRIVRLSKRESVVLFFEETQRSVLNRDANVNSMRVIEEIIENIPIYRLYCTPTAHAVEVTYNMLEEVL